MFKYDHDTKQVIFGPGFDEIPAHALLVNLCPECDRILRAYFVMPEDGPAKFNLASYLGEYTAAAFRVVQEKRYVVVTKHSCSRTHRCCSQNSFLGFTLRAAVLTWLEYTLREGFAVDEDDLTTVANTIASRPVPGIKPIKDEIGQSVLGFAWDAVQVTRGSQYHFPYLCPSCFFDRREPTPCPVCGETEVIEVEPETWEQYLARVDANKQQFWQTLGVPPLGDVR